MSALHPLDDALSLETISDDVVQGRTTPAYWNMAGPFGGITGALMLKAVLNHPSCRGRPVALTVNFCGAVEAGAFRITVRLVRDGRSTQHWLVEQSQEGRGVATTASVVTGPERETWAHRPGVAPDMPSPDTMSVFSTEGRPGWLARYEMRYATGEPKFGATAAGELGSGYTRNWVRDNPPRPLDYPALAAISDSFVVRLLQVRGDVPPVATSTLSTYFLADQAAMTRQGDRRLIGVADVRAFQHGFHDQTAELWSDDGELLAVSNQVVWFKG
jgi:acyl-CoA thioesterase